MNKKEINDDRLIGSLIGLVVADAYGVPYEFEEAENIYLPLPNRMVGYGTYNMPPGTWSDDSSLMLIAAESFISKDCFDYADIMNKFFAYSEFGYMTPYNYCFDIGRTTMRSIDKWISKSDMSGMSDDDNASNGSIMRVAPASIYDIFNGDYSETIRLSEITHSHPVAIISCIIYKDIMSMLYSGDRTIQTSSLIAKTIRNLVGNDIPETLPQFRSGFDLIMKVLETHVFNDDITSEGFAFDTLYVALRSFYTTDSFASAVKSAVASGGDTDTNAAVVGSFAGMYYGLSGIPQDWIDTIAKKEKVFKIIREFVDRISWHFAKKHAPSRGQ